MEPATIIAISAILGALGGLFHWLTPDPVGISKEDIIRRIALGAISGGLVGSPALYGAFQIDNTTITGFSALVASAIAVVATGYGGIEIKNLLAGKKPVTEKPVTDEIQTDIRQEAKDEKE